jgi:hypothetical protein
MKQNKSELIVETAHIVRELFQCKPQEHLNAPSFVELLQYIDRLYTTPPPDVKLLKAIILKVIPEMLELLTDAFKLDSQDGKLLFLIHEKVTTSMNI